MSKFYDPQLGEMVGIAEASSLSGIPKSTLRNWRKPDAAHLAKFKAYQAPHSSTVWYRLADLQEYLRQSGIEPGSTALIPLDAPNAIEAPLENGSADGKRHLWLNELAKINTETIEKDGDHDKGYYGKIQTMVPQFSTKRRDVMPDLFRRYFGLSESEPVEYAFYNQKTVLPDEWFVGGVLSLRRVYADFKGWDVSDEEICNLPIGLYVPYRNRKTK